MIWICLFSLILTVWAWANVYRWKKFCLDLDEKAATAVRECRAMGEAIGFSKGTRNVEDVRLEAMREGRNMGEKIGFEMGKAEGIRLCNEELRKAR